MDPTQALDDLIRDTEAFIAAPSFMGGVRALEDLTHFLEAVFGAHPTAAAAARTLNAKKAVVGDAAGLLAALKGERAATAIDWVKVIQIVIALIQVIGPIILK